MEEEHLGRRHPRARVRSVMPTIWAGVWDGRVREDVLRSLTKNRPTQNDHSWQWRVWE